MQGKRGVIRQKHGFIRSSKATAVEVFRYAVIYLACMFYWELLIYIKTQETIFGRGFWYLLFLIPISVFMAALSGFSKKNRRLNRIITAVLATIPAIYYVADLIYFASFGSLFSVSMMGMGGDAITNFWWSLSGTLVSNIPLILVYLLPVILLYLLAFANIPVLRGLRKIQPSRGYKPVYHLLAIAAAFLLWGISVLLLPIGGKSDASAYGAYHSKFIDTDTASQKLGALPNTLVEWKTSVFDGGADTGLDGDAEEEDPLAALNPDTEALSDTSQEETTASEETEGTVTPTRQFNQYEDLNFASLGKKTDDSSIQSICKYLDSVQASNVNEYTGKFEGYNLVYICAESFSSYALNEKVTPNICRLAREGFVLNNYYNSFKNTTTNGEFALLTGTWPDVARDATMGTAVGTMPQSANQNMYPALGNMFAMTGAKCYAYHNYKGSYYSRDKSLPNMGFEPVFANTGLTISPGWPGSDLEMFEQSVDKYIHEERFCTYYMTFSGHGDYTDKNAIVQKNGAKVKEILGSDASNLSDNAINYLACHYELDQALGYLLKRLQETGKINHTVIVMAGDHYPYYLATKSLKSLGGQKPAANFGIYKSTCILWNGGMTTPVQVDTPCCNVDILPTVLNLFNIPFDSRLYAGVDIFSDQPHIAQLYNKNFVTDRVQYVASSEKATWLDPDDTATEEEKQAYLDSMKKLVNKRYSISAAMHDADFYDFVYTNTNIPSVVNRDSLIVNTPPAVTPENAPQPDAIGQEGEDAAEESTASTEDVETLEEETEKKSHWVRNLFLLTVLVLLAYTFYEYARNQSYYNKKILEFKRNHRRAKRSGRRSNQRGNQRSGRRSRR